MNSIVTPFVRSFALSSPTNPTPPLPLLGTLGDSRIAQAFTSSGPGDQRVRAHGAASWIEGLTAGRVRMPWANSQAVSGARYANLLNTQLPLLLALNPLPTHCLILCGTNDFGATAQATIKAQCLQLWNTLKNAGIQPVQFADLPRTVASWNATDALLREEFNQWLRSYAAPNGVALVDANAAIADPNSANGDPATGYVQADGIHPTSLSAYQCGLALQAFFNQVRIPGWLRPTSRGDTYDATSNPRGNLIANGGLFSGTGGSNSGTGASGSVADGWQNRIVSGTGTAAATLVARADAGGAGWWQQAVIAETGGAQLSYRLSPSTAPSAISAGDVLQGEIDVVVAASSKLLYLELNCFENGGSGSNAGIGHANPGVAAMYLPAAYTARIITPPFTVTAGTTQIIFRLEGVFDSGGGATIQAGAASLRKVIAQ